MVHWHTLMYFGSRGTVTVMAPQWQLERIEVSVAAMLSRDAQAGVF